METQAIKSLEEYGQLHPADLADQLQRLPTEEAREILTLLPPWVAAAAVAELEPEKAAELLAQLPSEIVTEFLTKLSSAEAADLAQDLTEHQRTEALADLSPETSARVNALLSYPQDTAGGIMSDRFISLRIDQTIQECQQTLRARSEENVQDVSYLYVTDARKKLVGVISLRDLVFRKPERRIEEIMNRKVLSVRVDADQEEIARQFEHYHYLGLPVVDQSGALVGVVRANDIIQVAQDEATEDMQLMVGLSGEERALTPWNKSIRTRLPWLLVNLATAFLAAAVVGFFENTIARWTVLAIFLPIVAGQGGNAGAQTLTVIIRDLALGEISRGDGRKALMKEVVLGLANGLAIGLVVGIFSVIWKGNAILGLVVGVAMWLNMVAASLSGVLIPFGLKAMRIDPALASSIFLTTVTDVAGFFFFLGLATLALHFWGGLI
ncbi:MAG: magnesium transporter [Verrucomicrobiota bacterium]